MATFPILKTTAVAQYPAMRYVQFRNQTVRFVDGTEQRYRDASGPLHRWGIQLSELDESEIAAVEASTFNTAILAGVKALAAKLFSR